MKLLNNEIQKKELLAFEEKGTVNGSFSYSAPSGLHDDCVMALAIAWQGTNVPCIRMATCGRFCSDACSKMNGSPAVMIPHFTYPSSPRRAQVATGGRQGRGSD